MNFKISWELESAKMHKCHSVRRPYFLTLCIVYYSMDKISFSLDTFSVLIDSLIKRTWLPSIDQMLTYVEFSP